MPFDKISHVFVVIVLAPSLLPGPSSSSLFSGPHLSYWVVAVIIVARVWVISDNIGEFNFDGSGSVWFWVLVAVILIVSMAGVSCQCRWSLLSWCGLLLGQGWVCVAVPAGLVFGFNYCCVVGVGFNRLF